MSQPATEYRFAWHGINAEGASQRGIVIAGDTLNAQRILRARKIVALTIVLRGPARTASLRPPEVTEFSRQLASLLEAGLALLPALELIARSHARAALQRVVTAVAHDLACGTRFSDALQRYPRAFGALYCQLVRLGEATGSLAKLRMALTYPLCVLLLALAITLGLMIFVVPAFKQIFDGVGAQLPLPTRIVLALSEGIARLALPVVLVGAGATSLLALALRRSPSLRLRRDQWLLKAPLIGALLTQVAVARWSRALGTLLQAGTPLADAFAALRQATGNAVFERATCDIGTRLGRGQRLAAAMQACACFPTDVTQAIAVAEETGALDRMLTDLAALHERQADTRIAALAGLAEPLVIAVMGVLVGALVLAMYLPIIEMGNVI
jgi:type IV pilus assembly protein PilC